MSKPTLQTDMSQANFHASRCARTEQIPIANKPILHYSIEAMRDANKLFIEQMDAAELSPGQ